MLRPAREPLIQQSKSEVVLAEATLALQTAEQKLVSTKRKLALFWVGDTDFTADSSRYRDIAPPEPLAELEARLSRQPEQHALAATAASKRAAYEYEKRRTLPDPSISAGVRQEANNDSAFVVGLSMPIPVFDRNRGNIDRSRAEVAQAEADKEVAVLASHAALLDAYNAVQGDYDQVQSLTSKVLPLAEKAYAQSEEGYRAGRFAYLDVLDTQRTLNETRKALNEALRDYHMQQAEIGRLTVASEEPYHE